MANALNFAKKLISKEKIQSIEHLNRFEKKWKIVVYVPPDKIDEIIMGMSKQGAGKIGEYSMCSFQIKGTGTFKGGKLTNPIIGKKGNFEKADEVRLEMVCDEIVLDKVIEGMLKIHPYEEPAYEIYEIITGEKISNDKAVKIILKKAVNINSIISKLNYKIEHSFLNNWNLNRKLNSIIIDFDERKNNYKLNESKSTGTLKITKAGTGEYNISFI